MTFKKIKDRTTLVEVNPKPLAAALTLVKASTKATKLQQVEIDCYVILLYLY